MSTAMILLVGKSKYWYISFISHVRWAGVICRRNYWSGEYKGRELFFFGKNTKYRAIRLITVHFSAVAIMSTTFLGLPVRYNDNTFAFSCLFRITHVVVRKTAPNHSAVASMPTAVVLNVIKKCHLQHCFKLRVYIQAIKIISAF